MKKTVAMSLLVIAAVAVNAFAGAEARLTGKVTDAVTKKPITNATVLMVSTGGRNFKQDFKVDKDGSYRALVIDGTLVYKITFSAPGYQSYEESMKLKIGDVTTKDVALAPASAVAAAAPAAEAKPAVSRWYRPNRSIRSAPAIPRAGRYSNPRAHWSSCCR